MSQSLTKLCVHIIFSTRKREPFLRNEDIRKEMFAYLASVLKSQNSQPIIVDGTADHIHILCIQAPSIQLSKVVGEIKRKSSKWIKTKGVDYSTFYWQRGYGAFSVSYSLLPQVRHYISSQEKHHQKMSFREEYLSFIQKHEIEHDDQYMWD